MREAAKLAITPGWDSGRAPRRSATASVFQRAPCNSANPSTGTVNFSLTDDSRYKTGLIRPPSFLRLARRETPRPFPPLPLGREGPRVKGRCRPIARGSMDLHQGNVNSPWHPISVRAWLQPCRHRGGDVPGFSPWVLLLGAPTSARLKPCPDKPMRTYRWRSVESMESMMRRKAILLAAAALVAAKSGGVRVFRQGTALAVPRKPTTTLKTLPVLACGSPVPACGIGGRAWGGK
jgi:hypothetical protein